MRYVEKVNCRYGAPMGRVGAVLRLHYTDCTSLDQIVTRRLSLDGGGYDRGGAYWGCGNSIYAVWIRGKPSTLCYVDGRSRDQAIEAAFDMAPQELQRLWKEESSHHVG